MYAELSMFCFISYAILQVYGKLHVYSVTNLHPTFCNPWTVVHQAPLSMGFPGQEYRSGLPFPPPGDLPDPGIKLESPASPALAGGFFTTESSDRLYDKLGMITSYTNV